MKESATLAARGQRSRRASTYLLSRRRYGRYVDPHIDLHVEVVAFTLTSLSCKRNRDSRWHLSQLCLFSSFCFNTLSRTNSRKLLSRTSSLLRLKRQTACSSNQSSLYHQRPFFIFIPPITNRSNKPHRFFDPRLSSSSWAVVPFPSKNAKARNAARQRRWRAKRKTNTPTTSSRPRPRPRPRTHPGLLNSLQASFLRHMIWGRGLKAWALAKGYGEDDS